MRLSSTLQALAGLTLLASCAALLASCATLPQAMSPTPPTSWDHKSVRYRIAYEVAAARCDRQTPECVARAGAHYATREACIADKLPASAAEVDLDLCASYPLREHDLDECIAEIRAGRCGAASPAPPRARARTSAPGTRSPGDRPGEGAPRGRGARGASGGREDCLHVVALRRAFDPAIGAASR